MLDSTHPDLLEYRKDPEGFKTSLYRRLSEAYSSIYGDDVDGVVVALARIDEALHEGFTADFMVKKMQQAAATTEQRYRGAVSKFIRTRPWTKAFKAVTKISPATTPMPYEGPMPKRP